MIPAIAASPPSAGALAVFAEIVLVKSCIPKENIVMSSKNCRVLCVGVLAVVCTLLTAPMVSAADAPKVSTYAPAEDLANQADTYIKGLDEVVATEDAYKEGKEKIARDSNTLIVIALALGLHDQDSKYKASAGALVKASQDLAATKDYAAAKKGVDAVKAAAKAKSAAKLKWEKVASLPELMKQVPIINTKLKMNVKPAKLKKKAKETAGYTAVLAVIAQGTMADTSATKGDDQVKQWQKFSAAARNLAGEVNAAIHKGDQAATDKAMEKLNVSCEDCHAVFKPAVAATPATPAGK